MLRQMSMLALGLVLAALLAGCKPVTAPAEPAATAEATAEATATEEKPLIGMPNPASVFCIEHGGKLDIRDGADGQTGYCVFEDGSECEEWAYLRGECAPGEAKSGKAQEGGAIGMANPASVHCADNGGTLDIRQDKSGGEYGMCVFADGSECEEWAYFRGECAPGGPRHDANLPNPASAHCAALGGTVRIEQDASGGEYGMCAFADGHECEEWALLRGTCQLEDHATE